MGREDGRRQSGAHHQHDRRADKSGYHFTSPWRAKATDSSSVALGVLFCGDALIDIGCVAGGLSHAQAAPTAQITSRGKVR
jgi:hypothetical protein